MHRTLICTLMLAGSAAYAQAPAAPTATYEAAVTSYLAVSISRLRVTQVDSGAYAVDLLVVAPNLTQHRGHVQGLANLVGGRLILRVPNFMDNGDLDHPPLCTLVLEANETHARVVSADHCTGFHGAAASFMEQGQNLVRVASAR